MPSLHYMNPPPHPFWDFVAGIEDHPLFGAYGGRRTAFRGQTDDAAQPRQSDAAQDTTTNEKTHDKQPTVEDPPEIDPSTVHAGTAQSSEARGFPFRGRGRFGNALDGEGPRRGGHPCRGRAGPQHAEHQGPTAFGFGQPPFWARGPHGHRGPGSHHHHGPPRGWRRPSPDQRDPPNGERGLDLGQFLNNLGEKLGIDLAGAAEGLGVGNIRGPNTGTESDFEPRADIFDTASKYIVHLSLPGAKKEDVGVDWDGENSVLRIAGVVHRPDVDEELLSKLVVNGRKRETGVFEKAIRLGSKRDPASIDIAGIAAKMTDGVLVVTVPKIETKHEKREVPISGASTPTTNAGQEKDLLFDADQEMYDSSASKEKEQQEEIKKDLPVNADDTKTMDLDNFMEKEHEKSSGPARDDRSVTLGREEDLPKYSTEEAHDESEWEKYSDDEGEYVKINVD